MSLGIVEGRPAARVSWPPRGRVLDLPFSPHMVKSFERRKITPLLRRNLRFRTRAGRAQRYAAGSSWCRAVDVGLRRAAFAWRLSPPRPALGVSAAVIAASRALGYPTMEPRRAILELPVGAFRGLSRRVRPGMGFEGTPVHAGLYYSFSSVMLSEH